MRYLLNSWLCCLLSAVSFGQSTDTQDFVIKKERVHDYEQIFSPDEIHQLDSMLTDCWKKGIAEIAIVTIDQRHTDSENFDSYVFNKLTAYALGEYGKNNGIVIAISKQLRQMRIENGYGIEKILSDKETKKIIDEQFIPEFKEGRYYNGTLNGLTALIGTVEEAMQEYDYRDESVLFQPSVFEKIKRFVLENGKPQTFRNIDSDNPSYNFTSLDVFLGPSRHNAFVLKDFSVAEYYEMTIRDNDGSHYQFVCFDGDITQQTFIKKKMQPGRVYWLYPGDKFFSSDIWPLLAQIEDEIAQRSDRQ
ncbi:TPM domain-containing protein [Parapedobacter pyrenivorans]|uniref:TPM domain-containing protein n=1 Tax=Parapedobacter pyrenivorans TaxID=1305674 RepID=UPI003342DF7E